MCKIPFGAVLSNSMGLKYFHLRSNNVFHRLENTTSNFHFNDTSINSHLYSKIGSTLKNTSTLNIFKKKFEDTCFFSEATETPVLN